MELQNREGTTVDAVPFVVTCCSLFLVLYSFGPLYLLAYGFELVDSLLTVTVVFLVAVAAAYRRQISQANPMEREEVPASIRFIHLVYLMLIIGAIMVLLTMPLLLG